MRGHTHKRDARDDANSTSEGHDTMRMNHTAVMMRDLADMKCIDGVMKRN